MGGGYMTTMKWCFLLILLLGRQTSLFAQTTTDSLDIKIGQMIMIGINDRTQLSDSDFLVTEIREGKMGGVVLFEKNIPKSDSRTALTAMITKMKGLAPIPLFVSIDEEGGKVHRLKEKYGFTGMPSAAYLGQLNRTDSTLYYNRRLAAELASLGFNLNYAPSLDMAVNPENNVIVKKERSFSASPETISRHALQCIAAHHENGVLTVLKHFPGHGSSAMDSHLGLVDVSGTWGFNELFPFQYVMQSGQCDAVMTAHIVNRRWDSSLVPATLSGKLVNGILRGLMGYKGVVFSDDMQMHAISKEYGLDKALALCVNAGVDVLMFANNVTRDETPLAATEVHIRLKNLVRQHKIPMSRINESYRRIMAMKSKLKNN